MSIIHRSVQRNSPYATAQPGERAQFVGYLYPVPGQGTYSYDEAVTVPIRLHGGIYWCSGAGLGDTVSLAVVDKSGGQDVILAEYVRDVPLATWDHSADLTAPTAASIPAGLYLRVTIAHVTDTPMTLGVTYKWFEEGL